MGSSESVPENGVFSLDFSEDFSLELLTDHFTTCVAIPGIDLPSYLQGFLQVNNFLGLLNSLFGWVSRDIMDKIKTMQKLLQGPNRHHYTNIRQSCINIYTQRKWFCFDKLNVLELVVYLCNLELGQ